MRSVVLVRVTRVRDPTVGNHTCCRVGAAGIAVEVLFVRGSLRQTLGRGSRAQRVLADRGAAVGLHIEFKRGGIGQTGNRERVGIGSNHSTCALLKADRAVFDVPGFFGTAGSPTKRGRGGGDIRNREHRGNLAIGLHLDGKVVQVPGAAARGGGEAQGDASAIRHILAEGERTIEQRVCAVVAAGLGRNLQHFHEGGGILNVRDVTQLHGAGRGAGDHTVVAELQLGEVVGEGGQHQRGHGAAVTLQFGSVLAGMSSSGVVTIDERGVEAGQLGSSPAIVECQVAGTGIGFKILIPGVLLSDRDRAALGLEAELGRPHALVAETAVCHHINVVIRIGVQTHERDVVLARAHLSTSAEDETGRTAFDNPAGSFAGIPGKGGGVLTILSQGKTCGSGADGRHREVDDRPVAGLFLTAESSYLNVVLFAFGQTGEVELGTVLHVQGDAVVTVDTGHHSLILVDAINGQPAHVHRVGMGDGDQVLRSDTVGHGGEVHLSLVAHADGTAVAHHADIVGRVLLQTRQLEVVLSQVDGRPLVGTRSLAAKHPSGGIAGFPIEGGTGGGDVAHGQVSGSGAVLVAADITGVVNVHIGKIGIAAGCR